MKWNVGAKISLGFGLAVTIFVIVGIVSYLSTVKLVSASEWRKHTYDVLRYIDGTLSFLKDVETGQRGYVITGEEKYLEPYRGALDKIRPNIQEIRSLTLDNLHQQQRLDKLEPQVESLLAFTQNVIELRRNKGLNAATQVIKTGKDKQLLDDIRQTLGDMAGEENKLLQERTAVAQHDGENTKKVIALGTIVALLLAILSGCLITYNIARPLKEITQVAKKITAGDLNATVSASGRSDEVGVLAHAFDSMTQALRGMALAAENIASGDLRTPIRPQSTNDILGIAFSRMSENLRSQISELVIGANVLSSSASQIVSSTSQLAASASQSAAAVSETAITVEEVRQTAQVASQKAKLVSDSAQKAALSSQSGRKSIEDFNAGMERIRQQMDAIAAGMVRLSGQSQAIGQIMASVEDLAAQSNLLAVNAAIEAAKAGEHGKGFSVVAQEVKSLAEQSRQATNQVRTILGDIQKATATAVMATEQGSKAVEAGSQQTVVAGEAIQALAASINEAAQASTQIAASSQQQLVGVDQVAGAMDSIKQASMQNVASAQQLETAAGNLNELGQRLKNMVERYTL
ncbi:MAG TPA: CHASE3 domain-containing protein [Methylophilaceae bacterium]|nr:CHASE3 domain-containing protein [Methylophilaceae bacterium]